MTPHQTPALTHAQIVETGRFIASLQGDDGALPWFRGGQWDAWNHTEALMGLTVAAHVSRETDMADGEGRGDSRAADRLLNAARRGLEHLRAAQRDDGSWPMLVRDGVVEHDESDTNQCAYPAVGVWHLALTLGRTDPPGRAPAPPAPRLETAEAHGAPPSAAPTAADSHSSPWPNFAVLHENWPMVRDALTHVLTAQRDDGTIAWAINRDGGLGDHALLTGNASILQSLWAGVAIANHLDIPESNRHAEIWRTAGRRLAAAVRRPELFADRQRFSMDWFYPVLGGALTGDTARHHLDAAWDRFVWPGQGTRCVDDRPWVTGGESAELVMALTCLDGTAHEGWAREQARAIFTAMQHTRDTSGGYWTGYVVDDDAIWPREQTGWTAGAMLLAADALDELTPAANFFNTMTW